MLCHDPAELNLPALYRVRQHFDVPEPVTPANEIDRAFENLKDSLKLPPNAVIAVGVGSRGISRITDVISRVIYNLKAIGAKPFIMLALGSHGGATAEGQIDVLRHRGISEETCGVPVRATMDVILLGKPNAAYRCF